MVKQLQKEVARLEAELRTPETSACPEALLMEKELKIKRVILMLLIMTIIFSRLYYKPNVYEHIMTK